MAADQLSREVLMLLDQAPELIAIRPSDCIGVAREIGEKDGAQLCGQGMLQDGGNYSRSESIGDRDRLWNLGGAKR